jgi:hypothetical protein
MRLQRVIAQVKREIPSVDKIIDLAWENLKFTKSFMRKSFGKAILRNSIL